MFSRGCAFQLTEGVGPAVWFRPRLPLTLSFPPEDTIPRCLLGQTCCQTRRRALPQVCCLQPSAANDAACMCVRSTLHVQSADVLAAGHLAFALLPAGQSVIPGQNTRRGASPSLGTACPTWCIAGAASVSSSLCAATTCCVPDVVADVIGFVWCPDSSATVSGVSRQMQRLIRGLVYSP